MLPLQLQDDSLPLDDSFAAHHIEFIKNGILLAAQRKPLEWFLQAWTMNGWISTQRVPTATQRKVIRFRNDAVTPIYFKSNSWTFRWIQNGFNCIRFQLSHQLSTHTNTNTQTHALAQTLDSNAQSMFLYHRCEQSLSNLCWKHESVRDARAACLLFNFTFHFLFVSRKMLVDENPNKLSTKFCTRFCVGTSSRMGDLNKYIVD